MLSTADVVNKHFCKMAGQTTTSSIAMYLAKASEIIRREIFTEQN
jgi:hypothetical protein